MLKPTFLSLALLAALSFTGNVIAANYEVAELSPTYLMVVPRQWVLEEEKGSKLTVISYRDAFKEALASLSVRYKIKSITTLEGFAKKEELVGSPGGSLTVGLILEVDKK